MPEATESTHRERSYDRNIRYIAYSLLKDVRFCGEPVVPKIVNENTDEFGRHFNVEHLGGLDFYDFIFLPSSEVSIEKKLEVVLHITKQLKEIDRQGFVIFDRNSSNIRILNWKEKISTRQMDIEDYYDKIADATYSSGDQSGYEEVVDLLKEKHVNVWTLTIQHLIGQAIAILKQGDNEELITLLEAESWKPEGKKRGSSLNEFEELIKSTIDKIQN